MGWISIIIWVITNIPNFIAIIREILALIHSIPAGERVAFRHQISDAIQTGDHELVKAALTSVHTAVCSGVACPTPTLAP